ncbi:MAG: PaaI family thioesterase [Lachnospiraceae bacterium]|nr:PaaI family thioesterase [Lachnospiraceae bacterium]
MGTFATLQEAREHFINDRFAMNAGMQIDEITEDTGTCSVVLTKDHQNAYGGIMGGAIFTLADLAFAVVANQIHSLSVASQVSINYLSAPKGSKLIARARCLRSGRTTSVIQVDVSDDTGRDVALFIGTAFKK